MIIRSKRLLFFVVGVVLVLVVGFVWLSSVYRTVRIYLIVPGRSRIRILSPAWSSLVFLLTRVYYWSATPSPRLLTVLLSIWVLLVVAASPSASPANVLGLTVSAALRVLASIPMTWILVVLIVVQIIVYCIWHLAASFFLSPVHEIPVVTRKILRFILIITNFRVALP